MRVVVVVAVALVGCHDGGGDVPDASPPAFFDAPDPCAKAPAVPHLAVGCKQGALANISLDGTWTFTGTESRSSDGNVPHSLTAEMKIEQTAPTLSGWCSLNVWEPGVTAGVGAPAYINDTFATYSWMSSQGQHLMAGEWVLCVDPADDLLTFDETSESNMGGGHYTFSMHGVLKRSASNASR